MWPAGPRGCHSPDPKKTAQERSLEPKLAERGRVPVGDFRQLTRSWWEAPLLPVSSPPGREVRGDGPQAPRPLLRVGLPAFTVPSGGNQWLALE